MVPEGGASREGRLSPELSANRKPDDRDTSSSDQSVDFLGTGVDSEKALIGGWGHVGCTGVGTAELGLMSMAL